MSYSYDPEIAPVLGYLPTIDLRDITGTRARLAAAAAQFPPFVCDERLTRDTLRVPAAQQRPEVELLVLRPAIRASAPAPLVVWFHGGGFVLGDAHESLPFLEQVALATGAVTVSVQYRLAPETQFPGALDDGVAAVTWLAAHAAELGIDPQRIAIGGQSSGGAHAARVAIALRDTGGPALCQMVLDVPVTDSRVETESVINYRDTPMWDTRNALLSWQAYAGNSPAAQAAAAPATTEDLSGLPATFIAVNQFDPLRDEGLEFARRLAQAGVPSEAHLYAGTFHASAALTPHAGVSQRQQSDLLAAFERAFSVGEGSRADA